MTDKPKPNPAASALARKRWAGTTPEQRREATRAATAASPRTKKREPGLDRECNCGVPVTSTDPDVTLCEPCLAHALAQEPDADGTVCYERPKSIPNPES